MFSDKNYLNFTFVALRQKFCQYAVLIFSISACIYSTQLLADTNVNGDEIEIITDELPHDALASPSDPVLGFIENIDGDPASALANQADLWARIKAGYAMPDIDSEYTANFENWYAARPDYVEKMLTRSQKYLYYIVEEVEKRGMPTEIALLPMIESAYNPMAYSRSHASGIWQFVPATGKHFGLKQNWWVDNRRSVVAATDAALDYLQKLYGMFGSWDLALAAYNAGEGTVGRAIERNKAAGLPIDYQSLNLPVETKNYVPKLQAIKNIINQPEQYGLSISPIPNQAYFTTVNAPNQIDAKLAAKLAEISLEELNALNPGYNRPVIASKDEAHHLLLPVWAAERFKVNLDNYDKPLISWQTYTAKRGERMDSIAKKFGINVSQLRDINGLSNNKKIRYARPMLVPAAYTTSKHNLDVSSLEYTAKTDTPSGYTPAAPTTYKVRPGDTLHGIADKYDISAQTLMKYNRLSSSKLKVGQTIKLSSSNTRASKASPTKSSKIKAKKTATKSKRSSSTHINTKSSINIR